VADEENKPALLADGEGPRVVVEDEQQHLVELMKEWKTERDARTRRRPGQEDDR